jgi:hypothetical protein
VVIPLNGNGSSFEAPSYTSDDPLTSTIAINQWYNIDIDSTHSSNLIQNARVRQNGEASLNCIGNSELFAGKTYRIQFMYALRSAAPENYQAGDVALQFSLVYASGASGYVADATAAGPFTLNLVDLALKNNQWIQFDKNVKIAANSPTSTLFCISFSGDRDVYLDNIIIVKDSSSPSPLFVNGNFELPTPFLAQPNPPFPTSIWFGADVTELTQLEYYAEGEHECFVSSAPFQCLNTADVLNQVVRIQFSTKVQVKFSIYFVPTQAQPIIVETLNLVINEDYYEYFDSLFDVFAIAKPGQYCFVFEKQFGGGPIGAVDNVILSINTDKCKDIVCQVPVDPCLDMENVISQINVKRMIIHVLMIIVILNGGCHHDQNDCDDKKQCTDDECVEGVCENTMNCHEDTSQC